MKTESSETREDSLGSEWKSKLNYTFSSSKNTFLKMPFPRPNSFVMTLLHLHHVALPHMFASCVIVFSDLPFYSSYDLVLSKLNSIHLVFPLFCLSLGILCLLLVLVSPCLYFWLSWLSDHIH